MTMILNKKYVGKGSYKIFISNRVLRLFPAYLTTVFFTIVVSIMAYTIFGNWLKLTPWISNISIIDIKTFILLILTNIFLVGQDIVMFTGIDKIDGTLYFLNDFRKSDILTYKFLLVPQAWSISVELLFYIIAPFIVRQSIKHILWFISISILIRAFIYFYLGWKHDPWTYRFFPTELALFLFGSIAFKIFEKTDVEKINVKYLIIVIFIYFLIIIFYQFIPGIPHIKNWFIYVISIWIIPILFLLTKNIKVDNFIGELSYPIYLIHILAISISTWISKLYIGEITIILSILGAILMVKYIEKPIDKLRQERVKNLLK